MSIYRRLHFRRVSPSLQPQRPQRVRASTGERFLASAVPPDQTFALFRRRLSPTVAGSASMTATALGRALVALAMTTATAAPAQTPGTAPPPIAEAVVASSDAMRRPLEAATEGPVDAPIEGVLSFAATVEDLDRSVAWYQQVLNAAVISIRSLEGESFERLTGLFGARARVAVLEIGSERLELMEMIAPKGRPFPPDSRSNDRWFQHIAIIVRDMDEAYARLTLHEVAPASPRPQRLPDWNPGAGGIEAYYFRDPDGHYLEILEFPPGKGDPRWQSDDRLFLGIDHTAIVVDDTLASLAFYRDFLGLRVVAESRNYGPEQERLNAVFPAHLRITTLRAAEGPAVELLEYLTPRDGRPMPLDSRPNDLWHWHVVLTVTAGDSIFDECRSAGGGPISPGWQSAAWLSDDPGPALMARDPDGHALLLIDRNNP